MNRKGKCGLSAVQAKEIKLMPVLKDGSTVSRVCSMDGSVITIGGLGAWFFIPFSIFSLLLQQFSLFIFSQMESLYT